MLASMAAGESLLALRERRSRRSTFWFGAAVAASISALGLLPGAPTAEVVGLSLVWAACLLGLGALVGRGVLRLTIAGSLSSLVGLALFPLLFRLLGASSEALQPALLVMPVFIVVLSPDDGASVWITGVGALGWLAGLGLWDGAPATELAADLFVSGLAFLVALRGLTMQRRFREAQREAAREQIRTEQRLVESETRRAGSERLAVIGQLAAGVAHEINNPLAFVASNVGYLEQRAKEAGVSDRDFEEAGRDLHHGLDRIRQIVVDLSRFSRKDDASEPAVGRAREAIEEASRVAAVRTRAVATVQLSLPPAELPEIAMAERRLVQVLVNLLVNASDALEGSPPERPRTIHVALEAEGAAAQRIVVEDTGPGMSAEVKARVFDPFFTTKALGKGTGLGLALAREYLEAAGGSISVGDRPGGGARFVLHLPNAPT